MNRNQLLKQIMEYDFVLYELQLYLDTHPNDMRALKMFKQVSDTVCSLRKEFESKVGPIIARNNESTTTWQWLESPWPWEN